MKYENNTKNNYKMESSDKTELGSTQQRTSYKVNQKKILKF